MARNKENRGVFDVADLAKQTMVNIESRQTDVSIPAPASRKRRASSNRELKSKRLNVVLRPSVYDKLVAAADADGRSVNAFLEKLIADNT